MAPTPTPEPPPLPEDPPAEGAPFWHWLGGSPALDLVNTRRRRWAGGVELLCTPADLGLWLHRAGLLPDPHPVPAPVLEEARALREAIDACVVAVVAGDAPDRDAVTLIDDHLVHAGARPRLALGADGLPLLGERPAADSPRRALGEVALDAARLLGDPAGRARLRICDAERCTVRFLDRSPAGRRRWCSMQRCGNAAKARRHRERQRSA